MLTGPYLAALPVALILIILGVGWVVRYSRRASKFRAFWNQPTDDYELKQHHASLLHTGGGGGKADDNASIRSKSSVATVPKSTSTGRHGRSPLSTYIADDDVRVGDRQCACLHCLSPCAQPSGDDWTDSSACRPRQISVPVTATAAWACATRPRTSLRASSRHHPVRSRPSLPSTRPRPVF